LGCSYCSGVLDNRPTSDEKLGDEIGLAQDTVYRAFHNLLDSKYIAVAPDQPQSNPYQIRDPQKFVVTPLGRRALRPFLGTFGFPTLVILTISTFGFGAMLGMILFSFASYPSYWPVFAIVSVPLFVVMVIALYVTIRDDANRRGTVISTALRKRKG
jgi:hypothetical protein